MEEKTLKTYTAEELAEILRKHKTPPAPIHWIRVVTRHPDRTEHLGPWWESSLFWASGQRVPLGARAERVTCAAADLP